ncbi:MAG TPA: protein BatD [Candidatus Limisoma intestinavium]|uniref:Protein BatD n=1 Tax=Candidatus Limisoma intestinavium TaxID=2840856 RepID=A0A9D1IN66_9BACT|nr:protein BatD [Candidatus Limisoma intestinavium]
MSLHAASVSFRVEAPSQVIEGNKFSITYVLENSPEYPQNIEIKEIPNCRFLFGPAIMQSSSDITTNGKRRHSSSVRYTYTYRAEKQGTVKISAANAIVGGKTLSTRPVSLEILPPDRSATNTSGNRTQSVQVYDIDTQTADKPIGHNDVFVRIVLSKPSAYVQEGVLCSIKLYSKYQISKFLTNVQPSYNGFMAQEVPVQLQGKFENVNGENYYSYVVKQSVLFPQQSGQLKISSGSYELTVVQFETINTAFGRMRSPVEKTIKLQSNSASLDVRELPTPRPADFTGAVGNFKVSCVLPENQVRTNEASSVKIVVSGSGNLKGLTMPKFNFPSQFDMYDPQTVVSANPSGSTLTGKVEAEYTFVPQSVGTFKIEGTSFSYFNPASEKYEHVNIEGFNLNVAKGTASNAVRYNHEPMRDILPIYTGEMHLSKDVAYILGGWHNVLFYVVLSVVFLFVAFLYRRTLKLRANEMLMKRKGANKIAIKRLKRAKRFLQKGLSDQFYEEMLTALWGYFSDKLSIPVSELNRDNISKELTNYGMYEADIDRIIRILDECEFARYAQSAAMAGISMDKVFAEAVEAIGTVENTKTKPVKK